MLLLLLLLLLLKDSRLATVTNSTTSINMLSIRNSGRSISASFESAVDDDEQFDTRVSIPHDVLLINDQTVFESFLI